MVSKNEVILIVMVGLPCSGKSTWARQQDYPIVCPDSIRLALHGEPFIKTAEPIIWAITEIMVRSLFLSGHQIVILDACNITRKRRDMWQSEKWDIFFKLIDTSKLTCIDRAKDELIPVIERMAINFDALDEEELRWE